MPMNTGQFSNLYLRKIDRAFFEAWDEETEQWSKYLQDASADSNNVTVQTFAGIGRWAKKEELANPQEQKFKLGDLIVTTFDPFAVEIVMSREQVDDAKYNEVENMVRDAGHAGRDTVEAESVKLIDNAFTVNQYDGVPLFSNAHPNRGDGGGTQSNLATGALTDANLKAGIVLFRKQKDDNGKKIYYRPYKLLVHQAQQFTTATILQSAQTSGTANNDKNTLPNLELVISDFMSSETAWILLGKRHQLKHYWRVKPEFKREKEMRANGSWAWQGYFRHATAVENWRQTVGSTGA
jgi:phage major head subunit gpT-like protein